MNYETIGLNMLVIDKYFKIYMKNALKEYDLNAAEGLVLIILYKQKISCDKDSNLEDNENELGKTQEEIISKLHYDKGVITRTMKSLEQKNYVIRQNHPKDSRSYIFKLTKKSWDLEKEILEVLNNWHKILLQDIDDKTIELLKSNLPKMFKNAINLNKHL